MKYIISLAIATIIYSTGFAQFVARMEVKKPIDGVCDNQNVCVIFRTFKGQEEAKCPVSKQDIVKRLNTEVTFLKDSLTYQDKGMVNIIINCKGEVVQCEMDNKTRHEELNKEIVSVFKSLGKWKPGKINGYQLCLERIVDNKIRGCA